MEGSEKMKTNNKKKVRLRWKFAIIGTIFPLFIYIILNINKILDIPLINYVFYLIVFPVYISGLLLSLIKCPGGLACVIYGLVLIVIFLFLFYGFVGFVIGYLIEKIRKR